MELIYQFSNFWKIVAREAAILDDDGQTKILGNIQSTSSIMAFVSFLELLPLRRYGRGWFLGMVKNSR